MITLQDIIDAANKVYPNDPTTAKLCATQAILESGYLHGGSQLANKYNNWFGIKGKGIISGRSISLPTSEYINKKWIKVPQDFAWNDSIEESFMQHRKLMEKPRYKEVWRHTTIEGAAKAVWECGYATDFQYSQKLIALYNKVLKPLYEDKSE